MTYHRLFKIISICVGSILLFIPTKYAIETAVPCGLIVNDGYEAGHDFGGGSAPWDHSSAQKRRRAI